MLGAIIGDVIGSPYEFGSDKTKEFLLHYGNKKIKSVDENPLFFIDNFFQIHYKTLTPFFLIRKILL